MPARELPHYWTPEQVRQILVALPAGQPWLFALLLWRAARLRSAGLYVTHVGRTKLSIKTVQQQGAYGRRT